MFTLLLALLGGFGMLFDFRPCFLANDGSISFCLFVMFLSLIGLTLSLILTTKQLQYSIKKDSNFALSSSKPMNWIFD